jgi:glycosyltransferase involved in cell wall biosynthesis
MNCLEQTQPVALDRLAVLIPAWQPEACLAALASNLVAHGFGAIIIVDDGSDEKYAKFFRELALLPYIQVLRHTVNLGKGRALKTGINHFLSELREMDGLVTADADGQHKPADIVRVAQALLEGRGRVVLGSRSFASDVPLRSRFGNGLTRYIFALVTGSKLADTQTGLRAFPRNLLPDLLAFDGERYEYEMTVLVHLCRQESKPLEVPIETIYIDGNHSSHFNPIRDSMRIYFVLVRFYFSAIMAAGIDFAGFSLVFAATHNLLLSVAVGRLSSLANFALNRKFVFHNRASMSGTIWRYYVLAAGIATLSYLLIWTLTTRVRWNVFVVKVTVDTLLSLVSFSAQRTLVFHRSTSFERKSV